MNFEIIYFLGLCQLCQHNFEHNRLANIQIHVEGVAEILSNIDPNKVNGPDNLPARSLALKLPLP